MNDAFLGYALNVLNNTSTDELLSGLRSAGIRFARKTVPSRNQREGRYAGALNGRHYRTRGVNNTVSSLDVCIELEMRRKGDAAHLFIRLFGDIGLPLYMFADDRAAAQEGAERGGA
jgi:hypothetical protein